MGVHAYACAVLSAVCGNYLLYVYLQQCNQLPHNGFSWRVAYKSAVYDAYLRAVPQNRFKPCKADFRACGGRLCVGYYYRARVSCLLAGKRLRRGCVDGGFRGAGKDNSLGCGYTYNEKASKPHGVLCNSRRGRCGNVRNRGYGLHTV